MIKYLILKLILFYSVVICFSCEDNNDASRCDDIVRFTVDCYREVTGLDVSDQTAQQWRETCLDNPHSNSCLECAMNQSCQDYINNPDYVYNTVCREMCP